ncbi:unnamed protein product [Adineta steineri]|uniref:Uncharacterized protein n=1 Tax=Adineta steineri TaxID=433720 RepID=A0A819JMX3_9BILA|nr:unnamed protein product [Adineta steineri]CAF3930173.1 unnamed protein product [Adineta steineri]
MASRIRERANLWLLATIIANILDNKNNLLNTFLNRVKLKRMRLDNNDEIDVEIVNIYHPHIEDAFNESLIYIQPQSIISIPLGQEIQTKTELIDAPLLKDIRNSLGNFQYNNDILRYLWKTILTITSENTINISPNIQISIETFNEYILHSKIKSLFYRLLLHAGITEEQLEQFMLSICQLTRELSNIE